MGIFKRLFGRKPAASERVQPRAEAAPQSAPATPPVQLAELEQVLNEYVRELDSIVVGKRQVELREQIIQAGIAALPLLRKKVNELIGRGDSRSLGYAGVLISLLARLRSPERDAVLKTFLRPSPYSGDYGDNVLVAILVMLATEAAQGIAPSRVARDEMLARYPELVDKVNRRLTATGQPQIEHPVNDPHAWLRRCDPRDKKDLSRAFWTTYEGDPHPDFAGLRQALTGLSAEDQRFVWWDVGVYLTEYSYQCYVQGLIADPRLDQLGSYLNTLLKERGAQPAIVKQLHAPDDATRQRVISYLETREIPQAGGKMDLQLLRDLETCFGFPGEARAA